jgi:8-oxo-dGTP diphosphatase
MNEIRSGYYRVSVKALILNDTRDKFLICKEDNGMWDLPGGGLEWGTTPQDDLPREIQEEMGLLVTKVANNPSYFITDQNLDKTLWLANVVYETELKNFDFTPSNECVNIKFVDKTDVEGMKVFTNVQKIAEMFNPKNHQ